VTPLADVARAMFSAAVAAVQPEGLMRRVQFLDDGVGFGDSLLRPAGRLVLVALGKAGPGLAAAFLGRSRRAPDAIFVLAPRGVGAPAALEPAVRRGAHPMPDGDGEAACRELLELIRGLDHADGVLLLLSGGSSALLAAPLPGLARERVTELTGALLAAGADIHELNAVRKHVLAATGGRLAAACAAPILTLALSDVPGDALATIGSGPTVGDPTTWNDALGVLDRHRLTERFPEFAATFRAGIDGTLPESPKPDAPELRGARTHLLGSSREALAEAARTARGTGFAPVILTRRMRGEAREVGRALAGLAGATAAGEPLALLLAGETTVTVRGGGRGGRNLELALAAALDLAGVAERCVLAAGTDGADGGAPAAGAVVDGQTVARGLGRGRDAVRALGDNDSWGYFAGSEEAIVTGPTGTNTADVAFVLAAGRPRAFLPRGAGHSEGVAPIPA